MFSTFCVSLFVPFKAAAAAPRDDENTNTETKADTKANTKATDESETDTEEKTEQIETEESKASSVG